MATPTKQWRWPRRVDMGFTFSRSRNFADSIIKAFYFDEAPAVVDTVYIGASTRAVRYLGTRTDEQLYLGEKTLFP